MSADDRNYPSDIAFTDSVKQIQASHGSRHTYERMESGSGWKTTATPDLVEFLPDVDMFYLGTANAEGQPYIQYRGGTRGFLKVVDDSTLGFADFGGNRQFISTGNLAENPKAFIFLMDYVNARRIKLWGTARIVDDDPELLLRLSDPDYPARVERAVLFSIEAWDVNCPQHIHPRVLRVDAERIVAGLRARIAELETELEGARNA